MKMISTHKIQKIFIKKYSQIKSRNAARKHLRPSFFKIFRGGMPPYPPRKASCLRHSLPRAAGARHVHRQIVPLKPNSPSQTFLRGTVFSPSDHFLCHSLSYSNRKYFQFDGFFLFYTGIDILVPVFIAIQHAIFYHLARTFSLFSPHFFSHQLLFKLVLFDDLVTFFSIQ